MNDTCATHRSRVPRRSSGRNKRRSDDIGRRERTRPGLYFMFCVRQSSARGCRFSVMFVYLIKCVKCSPVPASFFPYIRTALQSSFRLSFYKSIRLYLSIFLTIIISFHPPTYPYTLYSSIPLSIYQPSLIQNMYLCALSVRHRFMYLTARFAAVSKRNVHWVALKHSLNTWTLARRYR